MASGKADLHMHSVYSDGRLTPRELVDKSSKAGFQAMSITDHDTVGAIEEAIDYGQYKGIYVIPGLEISAEIDDMEIHILGYFIDYKSENLLEHLSSFRKSRLVRSGMIVDKLNEMGSKITIGNVMSQAGEETAIGRPHIAMALNEEGFVGSYNEAFYKYIGDGKPAYIRKPNTSAKDAIDLISASGGLSFVAHPGRFVSDDVFARLISYGLDGIEIVHPPHKNEDMANLQTTAESNFLLTSVGSDYHGCSRNDPKNFGSYYVTIDQINNMKRRLTY